MPLKRLRFFLSICLTFLGFLSQAQWETGIVVNEFSNGPNAGEEYVELLVIGTACEDSIDLRDWIVDDNNGDFSGGPSGGEGIASGHLKFPNTTTWEKIPKGSLILIYNNQNRNPAIPADDPTDSNNDSIYILPANSALLEVCTSNPNPSSSSYSGCTYANGVIDAWNVIGLRNAGDAMQTRMPGGTYFHGLGYGNPINGGPDNIHFSGSGSAMVYFFGGTGEQDYRQVANWSSASTASETPAAFNNANNILFQDSLINLSSGQSINLGPDTSICAGDSLTFSVSNIYDWVQWQPLGLSTNSILIKPNDTINLIVSAVDNDCPNDTIRDSILIAVIPKPNPSFNLPNGLCESDPILDLITTLTASSDSNGTWSGPGVTGTNFNPAGLNGSINISYSLGTAPCDTVNTQTIFVYQMADASWLSPGLVCEGVIINLSNFIQGSGGGTFSGPGVTGSSLNTSAVADTITITYSVGNPGCSDMQSRDVYINRLNLDSTTIIHFTCTLSGSYTAHVSGTSPNFEYSLNGSSWQSDSTFTGLNPGNYNIFARDTANCQITAPFTISDNSVYPTINNIQTTQATCNGANASATINASSSNPPIMYSLDNVTFQASNLFTGLSAGFYPVYVQDASGCLSTNAFNITNKASAQIDSLVSQNASCGEDTGKITVFASLGARPYTYFMDGLSQGNDSVFDSLAAGQYQFVVQDADGCYDTLNQIISQVGGVVLSSINKTDAHCGQQDGSITVNASGAGALVYSLDNNPFQSSNVFSNLDTGNYLLTIQDTVGCKILQNVQILAAPIPQITQFLIQHAQCALDNGSIDATAIGLQPLSYSLDGGMNTQANGIFTGLAAGNYTLTIIDNFNCSFDTNFSILDIPETIYSFQVNHVACNGDSTASVQLNLDNVHAPYSINWSPAPKMGQGSSFADGFPADTITLSFMDSLGCNYVENIIITQPIPSSLSFIKGNLNCNGDSSGFFDLSFSGGTSPYTILWTDGDTNFLRDSLAAGYYTATITDGNGCQTLFIDSLSQPDSLDLAVSPDQSVCFQEPFSISAFGDGGSPNYNFVWDAPLTGPGPHNLSLNSDSCFQVYLLDGNGCRTDTQQICITVSPALSLDIIPDQWEICQGDNLNINSIVSGGNGAYSYLWENSFNTSSINISPSSSGYIDLLLRDGCSPDIHDSIYIIVNPIPTANLIPPQEENCDSLNLSLNLSSHTADSCVWLIDGNVVSRNCNGYNAWIYQAGTHDVELYLYTDENCADSLTFNNLFEVLLSPTASFQQEPDLEILEHALISLQDLSIGNIAYNVWYLYFEGELIDSIVADFSNYIFPPVNGEYTLVQKVVDANGCVSFSERTILLDLQLELWLANSFTPNRDGINDDFGPHGILANFEYVDLMIYNRWGQLVFHSYNNSSRWDGTFKNRPAAFGSYAYVLRSKLLRADQEQIQSGVVNLVR